ncbi:MAG: flagellin [Candidatus Zixiibacteriota bacterium]|nr:MAG: flagellin [candidate division Zixibacteria bacterium]
MVLSIFNDQPSSRLVHHINISLSNMFSSLGKLSSGVRINSAADGPAQLVISEQLRSQIASLNQEIENTNNLIYKYQTASGSLSGFRSQLTELRTLAVGAANEGFNSDDAQQAYAFAAERMVNYFNDAIDMAQFNGMALFDGSEGSLGELSHLSGIDFSSAESAEASIELIDQTMAEVDALQVQVGSTQRYELESHVRNLQITSQNLQAAESNLRDTDYGMEFSRFMAEQIKFQAGMALLSYSNLSANSVLSLLKSS